MIELAHHLFHFVFTHLAVGDANACFRNQRLYVAGCLLNGSHLIVQIKHLTTAHQFSADGFLYVVVSSWLHKCFDR